MKMDGRGRAECQNWEKRDINVILEIDLSYNKTKGNSASSPSLSQTKKKTWGADFLCSSHIFESFLEREKLLS